MGEMQLGPRAVAVAVRPQIRRGLTGVRPGKSKRESLGATTVRFVCLVGGEGLPAGVDSGTRRRPPLEPLLRRASGRGKATGGAGSS
jgi:hypothetical protein